MESNKIKITQGIHCKVTCNGEFRRFLFTGTEFSSLLEQVKQLLALDKEFVLKYKDNEGDLITISTNEELAGALIYSDGTLLRLTAVLPGTSEMDAFEFHHGYHHHPHHEHHGPYGPHRGCGGRRGGGRHGGGWGRGHHGEGGWHEAWKLKLTSKQEQFKSLIAAIDATEITPEKKLEREILERKLFKVEKHLAKLEKGCEKKWKKHKKIYKKQRKHCQVELSEEAKKEIADLKAKIGELKVPLCETKKKIQEKKATLKEAKISGAKPGILAAEISELRAAKNALKDQIKPLKKKISELKYPQV